MSKFYSTNSINNTSTSRQNENLEFSSLSSSTSFNQTYLDRRRSNSYRSTLNSSRSSSIDSSNRSTRPSPSNRSSSSSFNNYMNRRYSDSKVQTANSHQQNMTTSIVTKCTPCIIWQNIYQIFEFLCNGRLLVNETDLNNNSTSLISLTSTNITFNGLPIGSSSLSSSANNLSESIAINLNDAARIDTVNKYEYLNNLLYRVKIVKNPIDPSDNLNWQWDYKSSKHFKLLKLKLKLVNQVNQLIKLYYETSKQPLSQDNPNIHHLYTPNHHSNQLTISNIDCEYCKKTMANKKVIELKSLVLQRLIEYASEWKLKLERLYDRYTPIRLRNAFDINNLNDLNAFCRQTSTNSGPNVNYNLYSNDDLNSDQLNKQIEFCSIKIHSLLDLLVNDNAMIGIKHVEPSSSSSLTATSGSNVYTSCPLYADSALSSSSSSTSSSRPASKSTNGYYFSNRSPDNNLMPPPPSYLLNRNASKSPPISASSTSTTSSSYYRTNQATSSKSSVAQIYGVSCARSHSHSKSTESSGSSSRTKDKQDSLVVSTNEQPLKQEVYLFDNSFEVELKQGIVNEDKQKELELNELLNQEEVVNFDSVIKKKASKSKKSSKSRRSRIDEEEKGEQSEKSTSQSLIFEDIDYVNLSDLDSDIQQQLRSGQENEMTSKRKIDALLFEDELESRKERKSRHHHKQDSHSNDHRRNSSRGENNKHHHRKRTSSSRNRKKLEEKQLKKKFKSSQENEKTAQTEDRQESRCDQGKEKQEQEQEEEERNLIIDEESGKEEFLSTGSSSNHSKQRVADMKKLARKSHTNTKHSKKHSKKSAESTESVQVDQRKAYFINNQNVDEEKLNKDIETTMKIEISNNEKANHESAQSILNQSLMNEIKKTKKSSSNNKYSKRSKRSKLDNQEQTERESQVLDEINQKQTSKKLKRSNSIESIKSLSHQTSSTNLISDKETFHYSDRHFILIDFDFNLQCSSCKLEIENLSDLLPIVSSKLTNFNLNDYLDDFVSKWNSMDIYDKMLFEKQQQGLSCDENELLSESKFDLIKRIINECKHRLEIQQTYIMNLIECLNRSNEIDTEREEEEEDIEEEESKGEHKLYDNLRKNLNEIQMDFFKTIRSLQHDDQAQTETKIERTLSFNCLSDILQRFFLSFSF